MTLILLLRLALGGLFIYAGVIKAMDPSQFLTDVLHYRILPYRGAYLLAAYLPWLEIMAGVCFMFKRWFNGAAVILIALITIFMIALMTAWMRGLNVNCGCFGRFTVQSSYTWELGRDLMILIGLIVVSVWQRRQLSAGCAAS